MCGGEVSRRSPRLVPRGQTIMALPVPGTILLVGGPVYKGREFAVAANRRRLRVCDPLGAAYLRRSTVNLAYRWFCKLGIEDSIPDHSVFCRARHERFRESDALRQVFESVVAKCIAAGLVGGEAFSIDASLIRADAAKKKRLPGDQPIAWSKTEEASRVVREHLAVLDAARSDDA